MKKILVILSLILCLTGCKSIPTYEEAEYNSYDELSSEAINWGFVRRKGMKPEVMERDVNRLMAYGGYYMDTTQPKSLYLTFDEGYENGYTSKILDILAQKNVKAAFFLTGPYLENQKELVKRMIDEGHIIGNHTVNHINMPSESADKVKEELNNLNSKCEELYGVTMKYMRPPEGAFSEKSLAIAKDLGYKTILWSFAYKDWDINMQQGANHAFDEVTPYLHDGAILLLHAVSSDNAEALGDIIDYARDEGYEFKSLDELP